MLLHGLAWTWSDRFLRGLSPQGHCWPWSPLSSEEPKCYILLEKHLDALIVSLGFYGNHSNINSLAGSHRRLKSLLSPLPRTSQCRTYRNWINMINNKHRGGVSYTRLALGKLLTNKNTLQYFTITVKTLPVTSVLSKHLGIVCEERCKAINI